MILGASEALREDLLVDLREMLSEAPASARDRETRLLAQIAERPGMPIVLFGAGRLGRRTLTILRDHGLDAAAFLDNEPRLWGSVVDDVPVLSPSDGSARFAADGLAVVTIWRGEGGHDFLITRDDLRRQGWRQVESFIALYWGLPDAALPYFTIDRPTNVLEAKDDVVAAAELWSDRRSLREYVDQVRWRLSGDFSALSRPEPNQYFADGLVQVGSDEVFVDCGAFTGDTLLDVAKRVDGWDAYHAFEPDPESFALLQAAVASLPTSLAERVHLHRAATADRHGTALFNATGLGSARLSSVGEYEVECVTIDETVTESRPTFIKMDIEGAEAAALAGAGGAIHDGRPLLAISAYHKQADLWELPRLVHDVKPDYHLFLRPHAAEGFDTVLYGIHSDRLVGVDTTTN